MPDLKLIALDAVDLAIVSAHLQDAILHPSDMVYQKAEKRFALVANRFDWGDAIASPSRRGKFTRRRTGLRIERVTQARVMGFNPQDTSTALALLTMTFAETEAPSGTITLHFASGAAVSLAVECVEAALADQGAAWTTPRMPRHKPYPETPDPDANE